MEEDTEKWTQKGLGVKLGDDEGSCISNLRFADDVMLLASSKESTQEDDDFERSTVTQGLKIHQEKTKVFTNQTSNKDFEIEIDEIKVEVLNLSRKSHVLRTVDHFRAK